MNIALDLTINFERIGRNRNPPPLTYQLDPTNCRNFDGLMEAIYRHVGQHLSSREYWVDVTFDPDTLLGFVTIDGGRFGTGAINSTEAALGSAEDDTPARNEGLTP